MPRSKATMSTAVTPSGANDGLEVGEITLDDLDRVAVRAETGATGVDSALIAIDRDHPAARGRRAREARP